MITTKPGYQIIEKWEKFVSKPYKNKNDIWTVGFGHTRTVTKDSPPIDIEHAIFLMKVDVKIVETFINYHFSGLNQNQFNALVSLLFNIGADRDFLKTKTANLIIKNPNDQHIAEEWVEFRNAGGKYLLGLMRRRFDELSLYFTPFKK